MNYESTQIASHPIPRVSEFQGRIPFSIPATNID